MKFVNQLLIIGFLLSGFYLSAMKNNETARTIFNKAVEEIKKINTEIEDIVLKKDQIKKENSHIARLYTDEKLVPHRELEAELKEQRVKIYDYTVKALEKDKAFFATLKNNGEFTAFKAAAHSKIRGAKAIERERNKDASIPLV